MSFPRVYDLRNLETDKNKVAINLSSTPINNTQKTSLQNSSKNKNVKADKNQTKSDNSTKQASDNKTAETLSKLQEDINLSDAVENGTQLINDIKNAQKKNKYTILFWLSAEMIQIMQKKYITT